MFGRSSAASSYRSGRTLVTLPKQRGTDTTSSSGTENQMAQSDIRPVRTDGVAPDYLSLPDGTFALHFAVDLPEEYTNAFL